MKRVIQAQFSELPDKAFVKLSRFIQTDDTPDAPLPVSDNCIRRWTLAGLFPQPALKVGKVSLWRVGDIRAWLKKHMTVNAESSESEASK